MDYEEAFDNMYKSVDIFTEAVAREIDENNLNYLLGDKALDMGFCLKVGDALFETVYVGDNNDLMIRFKHENNSVLDYTLKDITVLDSLQIGLVCQRVLEMKKNYEVSFSIPKMKLTGTLTIEAFDGIQAKKIAENKLSECLEYNFTTHGVKLIEKRK